MKSLIHGFASVLLGLALGCGGDDDGGSGGEQVSVDISAAEGGEVEIGDATLSIPAGALAADTTITAASSTPSGLPDADTLTGLAYDFGPDGLEFLMPVTLALPVVGSPGADQEVVISWHDEANDSWEDVTTSATGGMATAEIEHFTTYIVRFRGVEALDCSFAACGGDLVDTWTIAGLCAQTDAGDNPIETLCPDATIDIVIDGEGTVTFNSDLTYAVDLSITGEANVNFPPSCTASYQDCNLSSDWTCTGTPAAGCDCVIPLDDVNGETGTYTTDGTILSLTATGEQNDTPSNYCVDGDTLKVQQMTEGGTFVYTATR